MGYSLGALFASEAIATMLAIYWGEAVVANEVLAATKGRAMGWGFVALGFGLAFGFAIIIMGFISAHMNPATCLALLILGKMTGTQFIVSVAGEFVGAFVGAVLVWIHFLPHFKTVPAPYSATPDSLLLKRGDTITPTALGIASYNPREEDIAARKRGFTDIRRAMQDIKYYLKDTFNMGDSSANALTVHDDVLVEVALGRQHTMEGGETVGNRLRRRSVQVCDVHKRLKDIDMEDYKNLLLAPINNEQNGHVDATAVAVNRSVSLSSLQQAANNNGTTNPTINSNLGPNQTNQENNNKFDGINNEGAAPAKPDGPRLSTAIRSAVSKHQNQLDKLYDAAVVADKNVKLSIFATRPAIYSPLLNFLCEFMCTVSLIFGALMIYNRKYALNEIGLELYHVQEGLTIGFFIFLLVLGLGGPTAIAANPARDFSPRLAHFVLPIPGKGRSEFYYSWIPFFAPLVGGCAAAGLFSAVQLMNQS